MALVCPGRESTCVFSEGVRALKKLMSTHDKPIVGRLEFLKRKECLDFSKWSPPVVGAVPNRPLISASRLADFRFLRQSSSPNAPRPVARLTPALRGGGGSVNVISNAKSIFGSKRARSNGSHALNKAG